MIVPSQYNCCSSHSPWCFPLVISRSFHGVKPLCSSLRVVSAHKDKKIKTLCNWREVESSQIHNLRSFPSAFKNFPLHLLYTHVKKGTLRSWISVAWGRMVNIIPFGYTFFIFITNVFCLFVFFIHWLLALRATSFHSTPALFSRVIL